MITRFLCDIFFAVVRFMVWLLPTFPSFEGLNTALGPVLYCLKLVNMFVSVRLVGSCFLMILVIYNIKFIWSLLMWLVRKIPGVS